MLEEERHGDHHGKWGNGPFPAFFGGGILILLGVLCFLRNQGYIDSFWGWFFIGLGCLLILEQVLRYTRPAYRRHGFGRVIGGIVLICIGFSILDFLGGWWPVLLIALGVAIIVRGIWRR